MLSLFLYSQTSLTFYLTVSNAVDGFAKSFFTLKNLLAAVLSFLTASLKYSSFRLTVFLTDVYPKLLIKFVVRVVFIFLGLSSACIF